MPAIVTAMKTHRSWKITWTIVGLLLSLACSAPRKPTERDTSEALARARQATNAFAEELKGTLLAAIEAGGPAHALEACRLEAQPIAKAHSMKGITVGRVSLKPRSPNNAPSQAERTVLEAWAADVASGMAEEVKTAEHVELFESTGTAQLHYMRPIFIGELCLNCHGPSKALLEDVRSALAEGYPSDQATEYSLGDLRGAFSVKVPLD